jgi:hypothetical protein
MSVMSNTLSIQTSLPILGPGDSTAPARSTAPASVQEPAKAVPLFVNPSFQFDGPVGLVVIEFHDETGKVTSSIPNQRQLNAYRTHQETPPGETPAAASREIDGKTSTR